VPSIRREAVPVRWPVPPAELLSCTVADWLTPAEQAEHTFVADCRACEPRSSTAPSCCQSSMLLDAFRRHWLARRAWLARHRVPRARWADLVPPAPPPMWDQ